MKQNKINPGLAVDVVVQAGDKIVLIRRKNSPFKGMWALPGGFVEYGEKVENAAVREIQEETGLKIQLKSLLGVYSDPKRDPRRHVVSVVFTGKAVGGRLQGADDAREAELFKISQLKNGHFAKLAFDHRKILKDYLKGNRK